MQESRDYIKTRMLRNAARAWGFPETEAENNFDPLVAMLLSACSVELEKISGEIQASRARVLERLVQILSPDALAGALPAHSIATALPVENSTELTTDTQLFAHRKMTAVTENNESIWKDFFFSPTASFRLNRASVRYMATGNQLYKMNQTISKEIVAYAAEGRELPLSTLWLAIDEPGVSLHNSLFYFDFRNEADGRLFYHQLTKASWHFNDLALQHYPGYGSREISGEQIDLHSILNREDDVIAKIRKHVNALYKHSFITVHDELGVTTSKQGQPVPDVIANAFSGKEFEQMNQQPLRWISVSFPESIPNSLLQDVVCIMNCFPVVNSRLHDMTHRLKETINIIPLHTEDLFLDLDTVADDEGKMLNVRPLSAAQEQSAAVLLRNGGVGRFDERDAAAIVDYLLQLLRDESAAFAKMGNDFMNSELVQLQQIINKFEQRLYNSQLHREQIPYLVIRNDRKDPWLNLFIRFWSTNGTEGNNIKAGTVLQLYSGGSLDSNQSLLVATTQGGRNKLGTTETVLAYKSALLSKDRLITTEDIKAFCHYQLGERVKQVEVQKGVMINPDRQQGFVKTIDVLVSIPKKIYEDMSENGELLFWPDNLKLLLEERSAVLMPYRVFIRQAAINN